MEKTKDRKKKEKERQKKERKKEKKERMDKLMAGTKKVRRKR